MDYKTPGVFVEELSLIPPSVASVATAVPAFIGHTAITTDAAGATLINRPIRITSLLDYTTMFGGEYNPALYNVVIDAVFNIVSTAPATGNRYYLYDALRHYFDNGGGPCYVVTVGDYSAPVIFGDDTTGLRGGLRSLEKFDEPTLLAAPDAIALRNGEGDTDFVAAGNLHQAIIEQCNRLQDRFGILDVLAGDLGPDDLVTQPIDEFRDAVGNNNLKYAAAYYPWLYSTYLKEIHFTQISLFDTADPPVAIPDATIDTMTGNPALDGLVTALRPNLLEEQRIFSKVVTVPVLGRNNYNPLTAKLDQLRAAVMAATVEDDARTAFAAMMTFVRQLALSFADLENDAGNSTALGTQLTALEADAALRTQISLLVGYEKNAQVFDSVELGRTIEDAEDDYNPLDGQNWIDQPTTVDIPADATDYSTGGNTVVQIARTAANSPVLQTAFNAIATAFTALVEDAIFRTDQAEKQLFAKHPFFRALQERIRKDMSLMPPSGAVAGVYANTDRSRGVWKAPANVSLRGVIAPAYKLTDQEQGSLNLHDTGKSVNAIRAFTGKGILVWGARTLAGNDNEWRYVNVRRFFIYVEESTKKASEPFVFEANDANTWIRIRAMIENFLTLQWRQGALAGASTKEAFYVKVGLGETMTAQDILEGRLIVEIGMAAVRPAEFIILRFSHKMQES